MSDLLVRHGMTVMYGCFWSLFVIVGIFFAQAEALILKEKNTSRFSLSQNYPNPFNQTTIISYQLATISQVRLKIYDIFGREVDTLAIGMQREGNYIVKFDGSQCLSGVYHYRLEAVGLNGEQFSDTKRMVLVK